MEETPEATNPKQVGKYHLVQRLAIGGMAEVFLACEKADLGLERLLVIKRILPHLAQDTTFVEMFLNEARVAARIQHPNVVQIYELGESGGFPFIAMEYMAGSTLKELIQAATATDRKLPVGVVLHLICQACAGAHAAHELKDPTGSAYGLVHRDLTPHNLMVTDSGHVRLLDFGIAKASQGTDMTRTGMLKGKISYMSPEQCRQEELDRRSDIFALGIVAWELMAGHKPFRGQSELATMQAIVGGSVPSLREARSNIPESVSAAIHRALAARPQDRYHDASAFRSELKACARAEGIDLDPDVTAEWVRVLRGEVHDAKQRDVQGAMERTLVTLSQVIPSPPMARLGTEETVVSTITPMATTAVFGAAGTVMLAIGLLSIVALVAVIAFVASGFHQAGLPARPNGEFIHIAVANTQDKTVTEENHLPVRVHLEAVLQQPVSFEVANSYEEAAMRLINGEVQFAVLPSGITNKLTKTYPKLHIMATKVIEGSANTDGYLLVPRESPITTVAQLNGHKICYSALHSRTGYELPQATLTDAGLNPETDVTWIPSGGHQQLLRDLLDGRCDAGGTYSLNFSSAKEEHGINTSRLRVLTITGRTPHDHFMSYGHAEPDLEKSLTSALLTYDPEQLPAGVPEAPTESITGFVFGDGLSGKPTR
ncbi:MAG: PhnD/SsuA/transferrin family substrate-binding protein [Rhodobacterales bacterium]|nr:PhnD/SsuA/transferrin family substrate-binding protein [Rhodobacterales bacterium]